MLADEIPVVRTPPGGDGVLDHVERIEQRVDRLAQPSGARPVAAGPTKEGRG